MNPTLSNMILLFGLDLLGMLIPFLAALLGGGMVLVLRPYLHKLIKPLLAFSGAFLLGICTLELLPGIYQDQGASIGWFILLGFFVQILLEFLSKGLEHGHVHYSNNIFPWTIFIGLCLHAFIEGMPLGHHEHGASHPLLFGVALHKLPIAIALVGSLYQTFPDRKMLLLAALLSFAFMAPLGTLVGKWFGTFAGANIDLYFDRVTALVAGVILHVSTTILFESSEEHRFDWTKLFAVLIGSFLAYLTLH